jgi:sarcosine oxidase subunit alpha
MRIDGQPNVRACMVPVSKALRCERQNAFPGADADILEAADLLFPRGMDHHTMWTQSRVLNRLFLKVVRQMAGAGTLPEQRHTAGALASLAPLRDQSCDVLVLGGGPAGLAAAIACAQERPEAVVLLVDEQQQLGGSLWSEPDGALRALALVAQARTSGVRLSTATAWLGAYPEDVREDLGEDATEKLNADTTDDFVPGVMALADTAGLTRLRARRIVFATGAYDQNLSFEDNDRPGILAARAVGRLVFQEGIHPGRVALLGRTAYGERLADGLRARGIAAVPVEAPAESTFDVLAVDALPAPATEPLRLCGLDVRFSPQQGGFTLADAGSSLVDGRTSNPRLFVAGDVTGWRGPAAAEEHGRRAGETVAGSW